MPNQTHSRAALARHASAIAAATDAVADAQGPLDLLAQTEKAVSAAEAALAAVAEREASDLRAWAIGPDRPIPEPRSKERREATERLADAKAQAQAARNAARQFLPAAEAARESLSKLHAKTIEFVRAVQIEELDRLRAEREAAFEEAFKLDAACRGVIDGLFRNGYPVEACAKLAKAINLDREAIKKSFDPYRDTWNAFADRLAVDPDATVADAIH